MSDIAIKINNLSKIYKLYDKPIDRLKESLSLSKKKYNKEYHALNNISFEVMKGETVGILGTNGSGKSTLLKIITGVLTPSSGSLEVNGKISALLELGAGFNPEYTGMENIYLNGTMMGYTKDQMEERVKPIIDFADIGEFIYQPVKTYSSGMFARLAFAVAINVEPEILIVDEALSVGDVRFQTKCINKMNQLRENGTTILFVSHATEQIKRFCTKAIWINKGEIVDIGKASEIVDKYEAFMVEKGEIKNNRVEEIILEDEKTQKNEENIIKPLEDIVGRIIGIKCDNEHINTFDRLEIIVEYDIYDSQVEDFLLGVAIYTPDREYIFGPNTYLDKIEVPNKYGRHKVKYIIPSISLLGGSYKIDVGIFNNSGLVCIDYKMDACNLLITNDYFSEGKFFMEHKWEVIR